MKHTWSTRFPPRRASVSGDWWNPLDDASAVADVATGAWDDLKATVPGFQEVSDAVDSVVTGPVRDFARTTVGRAVLSAVATTFTAGLAPMLGPQLATAAFAMPGMARGETFARAWITEFGARVEQTATILGQQYAGQIAQNALDKLNTYAASFDLAPLGRDFKRLASLAGVRQDYAAIFLDGFNGWVGDASVFLAHTFDAETGAVAEGPSFQSIASRVQAAEQAAYAASVAKGTSTRTASASAFHDAYAGLLRPAVHPSAPALGPLTGTGPAPAAAPSTSSAKPLSTGAKFALGAGIATAIAAGLKAAGLLRWAAL